LKGVREKNGIRVSFASIIVPSTMHISDETIRSWALLSFTPQEQSHVVRELRTRMQQIPQKEPSSEERIQAIRFCMDFLYEHIPKLFGSRPFLLNWRNQMMYVRNQVREKQDVLCNEISGPFLQDCEETIAFVDRILNIYHPKFRVTLSDADVLIPTDAMREADIRDPMTLDPLVTGTLYAFLEERFVASKEVLEEMIWQNVRGSSCEAVFVPLQNRLIPLEKLQWYLW
jgi:hypothetical protein